MTVRVADRPLAPAALLAPMAGITDRPFRDLVQRFGAGLVVSEMIASREMVCARGDMRERAELGLGAAATAVQIAGHDPHWMAEAARLLQDRGAAIIDINMGCPAKRVTGSLAGAALMRTPDLALRLIDAVAGAVSVPVTVKMRLGWDDDSRNAAELARRAEAAGVAMIVVHGRTRCQFYRGTADWAAIGAVASAVSVPVIANGDIIDAASARTAIQRSGAQGVMVGRGAQGRPWALARIAHALFGTAAPKVPVGSAFVDMVSGHYEEMLRFYGRDLGVRVARKHLGWYMDGAGTGRVLRRAVLTTADPARVRALLSDALAFGERVAA